MKKILLTLFAAIACIASANALEIAFDFTKADANGKVYGFTPANSDNSSYNEPDGSTISSGVATITMNKLTGNGCRFWDSNGNITFRINGGSGITVAVQGGTITNIAFTGSTLTALTENGTALSGGTSATWTGNAPSVSFANTVKNSSGKNQTVQIKTLTITYTPSGTQKNVAELSFPEKTYTVAVDGTFEQPALTCNSDGEVTYTSEDQKVATVDESTGEITIEGVGQTVITATSAETATYYAGKASYTLIVTGKQVSATKATAMATGKYFLMHGDKVAIPIAENLKYGYLYVEDCDVAGSTVSAPETNLFDFAAAGDGNYTIQDSYGRYLYLDATHSSLNVSATDYESGNYLWDVTIDADGTATIKNVNRNTMVIAWSEDYSNFSCAANATTGLPTMYISGNPLSNDDINTDGSVNDMNSVYYNLQGVRVENPSNGVFIRVTGNKAEKVIF